MQNTYIGGTVSTLALSLAFGLALACGPSEEAKTVTTTDTTKSGTAGNSRTKTSDTQILSSDGSKESTHTEQVKQEAPPK